MFARNTKKEGRSCRNTGSNGRWFIGIMFGKATKSIDQIQSQTKQYLAKIKLVEVRQAMMQKRKLISKPSMNI